MPIELEPVDDKIDIKLCTLNFRAQGSIQFRQNAYKPAGSSVSKS